MPTTYIELESPEGDTEIYKTGEAVKKWLPVGTELVDYLNMGIAGIRVKAVWTTTDPYTGDKDSEIVMCFRSNIPGFGDKAVFEVNVVLATRGEWIGRPQAPDDDGISTSGYLDPDVDPSLHHLIQYVQPDMGIKTLYIHSGPLFEAPVPKEWSARVLSTCISKQQALGEQLKYEILSSVQRDPNRPLN